MLDEIGNSIFKLDMAPQRVPWLILKKVAILNIIWITRLNPFLFEKKLYIHL